MKTMLYNHEIIPNRLICFKSFRHIKINNPDFYIKQFSIQINDKNKIEKIIIDDGDHPNCDPTTKEFCINDLIKTFDFNDETITIIKEMLKTFDFNSAYYQPWNAFSYID